VRRRILDKDGRKEMKLWNHGGGFSLDSTLQKATNDRKGFERLLRYCTISLTARSLSPNFRSRNQTCHSL
jgi:hypothetical protein